MSFNYEWDESDPTGTSNSRKLHKYIKQDKRAIAERMEVGHIALDDTTVGAVETSLLVAQGRHIPGKVNILGVVDSESDFPASPPDGAIGYTIDEQKLKYYYNSVWNNWPLEVEADTSEENWKVETTIIDEPATAALSTISSVTSPALLSCLTTQVISISFFVQIMQDDYWCRAAKMWSYPNAIFETPDYHIYFKLAEVTDTFSEDTLINGMTLFDLYRDGREIKDIIPISSLGPADWMESLPDPYFEFATPPEEYPRISPLLDYEDSPYWRYGMNAAFIDTYKFTKTMMVPAGIWAASALVLTEASVTALPGASVTIKSMAL